MPYDGYIAHSCWRQLEDIGDNVNSACFTRCTYCTRCKHIIFEVSKPNHSCELRLYSRLSKSGPAGNDGKTCRWIQNLWRQYLSPIRLRMLNSTQSSMPPSSILPLVCLFLQPAIQESISVFMVRVRASVNKASEKYQRNGKRYNNTTP